MTVVADTGPLVAFVRRDERSHGLAARLIAEFGSELLIPDAVVVEAALLLRGRVSPRAARAFLEDVATGVLQRVSLEPSLFRRAVEYERTHADLDLGIVDACVMALAEAKRASILTFDFADFRATRPLRGGYWQLVIDEDRFRRLTRP